MNSLAVPGLFLLAWLLLNLLAIVKIFQEIVKQRVFRLSDLFLAMFVLACVMGVLRQYPFEPPWVWVVLGPLGGSLGTLLFLLLRGIQIRLQKFRRPAVVPEAAALPPASAPSATSEPAALPMSDLHPPGE